MAIPFPSEEWVKELMSRLNSSAAYAEIAKNWEGDLLFDIEYPDKTHKFLYLDLWHGKCRNAHQVPEGQAHKATFTLGAPLAIFIKVLKSELDPIQAMVTGKLKVMGNMIVLMKNVPTVLEFVRTAQSIEADFPAA